MAGHSVEDNDMNEYEIEMEISQLLSEGKWKDIINFVNSDENFEARRLLWVWPTFNDLNWIKISIDELKLEGIVSIGCGTGLLEWIIQQHAGRHYFFYKFNSSFLIFVVDNFRM